MATFEFVEWLFHWLIETEEFEFQSDSGNANKNLTKHKVHVFEIEEIFYSGSALPLGVQLTSKLEEQRLRDTWNHFQWKIFTSCVHFKRGFCQTDKC